MFEELTRPVFSLEELLRDAGARMATDLKQRLVGHPGEAGTDKLVKGSHGRLTDDPRHGPLVISSRADRLPAGAVEATAFKQLVLDHLFD